jgi:hypothetical protein
MCHAGVSLAVAALNLRLKASLRLVHGTVMSLASGSAKVHHLQQRSHVRDC